MEPQRRQERKEKVGRRILSRILYTIRLGLTCWVVLHGTVTTCFADLQIGQPAPDFALPDEKGKVHRLADYRGKTVVLMFYPKDFTPG